MLSILLRLRSFLAQLQINTIAASSLIGNRLRMRFYACLGLLAGQGAVIYPRCYFAHLDLSNIKLGARVFLNHEVYAENGAAITIGADSCLSVGVKLLTTTHEIGASGRRVGKGCIRKPIVIGKGCWIGAGAIVLPGVTIEDGVIIGAGALVNRDCKANGLYAGVPARRIRDLPASQITTTGLVRIDSNSR